MEFTLSETTNSIITNKTMTFFLQQKIIYVDVQKLIEKCT